MGRRGYQVGWVRPTKDDATPGKSDFAARWRSSQPVFIPGVGRSMLPRYQKDIAKSRQLYRRVLDRGDCSHLLELSPYKQRLRQFDLLASVNHENDPQEIVTLEFDALRSGKITAEDLWCKISWLSYEPGDASLRFRFSFGLVHFEDVAADFDRQQHAARLTEALFPESALISRNRTLIRLLANCVGEQQLAFVERIVYFNAPAGGAEFHQDVERGHLGVVYMQTSGRTFWFALSKHELIEALRDFSYSPAWGSSLKNRTATLQAVTPILRQPRRCNKMLDDYARNEDLLALLNRSRHWNRFLIERGHGYLLQPGDALVLPQHDVDNCAWHSVFCPDKRAGEGLSFAFRAVPQ